MWAHCGPGSIWVHPYTLFTWCHLGSRTFLCHQWCSQLQKNKQDALDWWRNIEKIIQVISKNTIPKNRFVADLTHIPTSDILRYVWKKKMIRMNNVIPKKHDCADLFLMINLKGSTPVSCSTRGGHSVHIKRRFKWNPFASDICISKVIHRPEPSTAQ